MTYHLKKRTQNTLTLGTSRDLSFLLWIADQKGLFADEKLKINFKTVPYTRKAMEMLVEGTVDCAVMVETNVAYLGYIRPKIPVKCFASIEKRTADNIILRHEEDGPLRPQDLRGKLVGFMPRTTSHSFLMHFLKHHGISRQDIRIKSVSPQAMPDALIRGDVEAISCWHPYAHNAMFSMDELGMKYTHFKNAGFYKSEVVLGTTKPFLVKNRHMIGKLLRALRTAEDFMQAHKKEVLPVMVQVLKLSGQKYDDVWEQYKPALRTIEQDYIDNISVLGDWIMENDTEFRGHDFPDYEDLVDNSVFLDIFHKNIV